MKYPTLTEQIKQFPIYWIFNNKLIETKGIHTPDDYSHYYYDMHHYIKEQQYYRYPKRYLGKQKLILLSKKIHKDLHSGMSDERFFDKWNIQREELAYRNRVIG